MTLQTLYPDLVKVNSSALVKRYNDALTALGIAPTSLSAFQLDGMGWSPEVAAEKGERYYLTQGWANPFVVILTVDQRGSGLYAPVTSYERPLMASYYARFGAEIADLTRETALYLEFDQGFSSYASPQNLLQIESVTVRSSAGGLGAVADEQAKLVTQFRDEPLAWVDPELRQRIIASAKAHGDLRARRLGIPDVVFEETADFYTPAFGGVFVLRSRGGNAYLILEREPEFEALASKRHAVYLHDPELLEHLQAENFVDLDLSWYRANPNALRQKRDFLLADLFFEHDPNTDFAGLTPPQRKGRLLELQSVVPETLLELEYLVTKLERGDRVRPEQLSADLTKLLLRPHESVVGHQREVVQQLLPRLEGRDVAALYRFDREKFVERYETWPEAKRRWAVGLLKSME
ncbi:hypothetical protein BH24DEI2_BH24DEI2_08980 [soil metagenome]